MLLAAATANATTVTMDFESLYFSGEGTNQANSSLGRWYSEDGMQLSSSDGGFSNWYADTAGFTGSTALFNGAAGGTTVLGVVGGGEFDLVSIDLSPLHSAVNLDGPFPDPDNYTYVTFITDTGHSQTFDVGLTEGTDWVYDEFWEAWYATDPPPVNTFYFDEGFQGVTSVTWVMSDNGLGEHQFDNIVASIVPVPPAVWLFGSALIGLAGLRRSRLTS